MHLTQHRPRREAARGKETAELKRENNQLRRKISRMHRELEKLDLLKPEEAEACASAKEEEIQYECEECFSTREPAVIEAPGKIITICRDCEHRTIDELE